jgi:hypothetical protein
MDIEKNLACILVSRMENFRFEYSPCHILCKLGRSFGVEILLGQYKMYIFGQNFLVSVSKDVFAFYILY